MTTAASVHQLPVRSRPSKESRKARDLTERFQWVLRRSTSTFSDKFQYLPDGFPLLLDDASGLLCEPVLFWLIEDYYKKRPSNWKNTIWAYANDAKDWFLYLEEVGKFWQLATEKNLNDYCKVMEGVESPETGVVYATNTINRRRVAILQFYKWAKIEAQLPLEYLGESCLLHPSCRPSITYEKRPDDTYRVSAMMPHQARALMKELGSLPSEIKSEFISVQSNGRVLILRDNVSRSSRDRIICEVGVKTGLRISEIRSLAPKHFSKFSRDSLNDTQSYQVGGIRLKGGEVVSHNFTGSLIKEILDYMTHERAYLCAMTGVNPRGLFINPLSAGAHAGLQTSVRTIERVFHDACLRANLRRSDVRRVKGSLDEHELFDAPLFVFHDLRHTFAVWMYLARQRSGDQNPWLAVQQALHHKHQSTTIQIYLKSVNWMEEQVSDKYLEDLNARAR